MFYETNNIDNAFRFGDVLQGFVSCTPKINSTVKASADYEYQIEVSAQPFFAILSPCCSISDKVISLAPLIKVRGTFFNNPFFVEDLTRINCPVDPENSLPPQAWSSMNPEDRASRLSSKPGYVFLECFAYQEHDLFPEYTIARKEGNVSTRFYMIDFRHAFRVNCDQIKSPKQVPLDAKCLQLSVDTRSQLRDKISSYYSRVPAEDVAAIS